MKRLLLTTTLLALLAPASASAATLVNAGGTLTYTGSAEVGDISVSGDSTIAVRSDFFDNDPIEPTGCSGPVAEGRVQRFTCEGVSRIVIDAGAGDDRVLASGTTIALSISGGPGDDTLGGGLAADTLAGGAGDDTLHGGPGDTISGGTGIDDLTYAASDRTLPTAISLDGLANDGEPGASANVLPDVEDVDGSEPQIGDGEVAVPGAVTLLGSAAPNRLIGGENSDGIVGGAGADTLIGAGGDDTLDARDGFPDRVSCGAGTDTANVDPFDEIGDGCENVQVAPAGFGPEDRGPTIAFTTPVDAARVAPDAATMLTADAADDAGVQSVQFFDDTRLLCTVTAAPFTCAYRPRPEDVGRNLLIAVATDGLGQTATVTRPITVNKFKPKSVSLKARRAGGRFVVTGKVTLPAGPTCAGTVTVTARRGAKGVWRGTAKLAKDCSYRATLTVPGARKPRFTAVYGGSDQVGTSRTRAL